MKIKVALKKYWLIIVGVVSGALVGWLYWYNIGCENGQCSIKSDPWKMTLYGALMGGLIFDMIKGVKLFKSQKDGTN